MKKAAVCLFTATLLTANADLIADDQFSWWSSFTSAFSSVGNTIAHGVTSAADTVAHGVTSAANTVAHGVTSTANTVGNGITSTANTVKNGIVATSDSAAGFTLHAYQASAEVFNQVADDFENGADFIVAKSDWAGVQLRNPQTYINAIKSTAQACSTYFNDLNALTGNQLTPENLEMADEVLDMVFPEGAVVFDGITIALELAGSTADITNNINGISQGIQTKNYGEVVVNSFELFNTIMKLSGEGDDDDEGGDDEMFVATLQNDEFSWWSHFTHAFSSFGNTVAHGVTSAAHTVAHGVTSAANTVKSGVTSTADTVAHGVTSAANTVKNGVTSTADKTANGVTSTANTVKDGIVATSDSVAHFTLHAYQASTEVFNKVADDFEHGTDFIVAKSDWVAVQLKNPQTYINAIKSTARACSTYFNDLNALTGGQLTIENLEMADEVLDMVFPEGAVVFDGVTIALELAVGTADITNNINGISQGIQNKNYGEVVSNSFELFNTIMELSGEDDKDGEGEGDDE